MEKIGWMAAFLSWNAAVAWASPAAGKDREIVEGWVQQVLVSHPQSRTGGLGVESERVQVDGTRAWMPPFVEMDDQSDGLADVKLTQMIPWPGKTGAMEKVQRDRVGMAQADSTDTRRRIELAVREAAWMEWMNGEKARLLEEQEGVVRDLAKTAERNQAQGMATAADTWILRARTEQIAAQADQAKAEAASAKAMREGWTGPVGDPLPEPGGPESPAWNDSALEDSVNDRPDIVSMRREATMRDAMGRASEATLRPDLMVGAMAMRMQNGMPGWGLMAGFTVPFVPWSSGMANGQARGAKVQARTAQAKAEAMVRMARSEVADHSQRARAAWAAWKRLDSLVLPGEENALALTRTRYGQGSEMLSMVLAMEEMIRMTRMDAVMQRGTYELERARLAAAAGVEPDRLEELK
ncbi:MAG TPA: TolC family protein [Fibrobacteria bacterium]|nr:TolC family protein [Fibrobacteria bacterium]